MADTLDELKEIALQVRNATGEGENTAERVGRLFVGILELMADSDVSFKSSEGHDSFDTLKEIALQVRNATEEWENTAERVGRLFVGILNLLEQSGVDFEIAEGSDTIDVLWTLSGQVRGAIINGENTAERVGRLFVGILNLIAGMEVSEEIPVEFLIRSDLPGMYYSSTQDALNAVQTSYPDGLTRDVTITCVKVAKERRGSNIWLARMSNWNKNGIYMLTIDGADKLTYNCKSGGGVRLDHVDNIVFRNINFTNYANGVEVYSPDELSAISFFGDAYNYSINLYLENCNLDGGNNGRKADYSVITKNVENVYLVNNRIENCDAIALKMVDCNLISLIKNYIKADHSYKIGHPALCTLSNSYAFIAEDNIFTGDSGEYYFSFNNVERAIFRRNNFEDGGGEAIVLSSKLPMKELVLESNLFVNMLSKPVISWAYHYVKVGCSVKKLDVLNNTAYMSSSQWQQWFLRAVNSAHVNEYNFYNNIIIDARTDIEERGVHLLTVDTVNSGNNLYQKVIMNNGKTKSSIFQAPGFTGGFLLSELQDQGLEIGSDVVPVTDKVLDIQNGTNSYKLIAGLEYYADTSHLPAADIEYKSPAASENTRGCYNLAGVSIDDSGDVTAGYRGIDITEEGKFSSAVRYNTYADNALLLMHDTLNRSRFIRMSVTGTQHSSLLLGRYVLFHPMPEVDADDEYVADELYTINIE